MHICKRYRQLPLSLVLQLRQTKYHSGSAVQFVNLGQDRCHIESLSFQQWPLVGLCNILRICHSHPFSCDLFETGQMEAPKKEMLHFRDRHVSRGLQ